MYSARASACDLLLHYPHSWSDGSKATEHIFFHNTLIDNTNSFTQGWKDAPFVPSFMSSLLVSPFNLPPTLALRQAPFPLPLETVTHPPLVLQDIVLQQPSFFFSPSPLCCRRHIRITLLLHRQHKRWSDVIAKRVSTAISLTSPDVAQIRCRTTSLRHAALAEAITSGNARVSPFCASSYFLSPTIVMKHMSIDRP